MSYTAIIMLAIIVEGVITYIREIVSEGKIKWPMVAAILTGVLVAVAYQADFLAMAGLVSTIPYVGCVLTGILISRGSNYIFDLIRLIGELIGKVKVG